ncbi:MAG: tetratricopeptide repeat protein [Pseudomonadota bacterium]
MVLVWGCALMGPRPAPEEPGTSREQAVRGSVHFEEGRLDRAERDFKAAFRADEAEGRFHALARDYLNLAALASRRGRSAEALGYLERAADIQRRDDDAAGLAETLAAMAAVQNMAGSGLEAGRLRDEALRLCPARAETRVYVLNVKGAHLIGTGDFRGAEVVLKKALVLAPEVPDARRRAATLHYLGRCARGLGRPGEAGRLLGDALKLDQEGDYPAGVASDLQELAEVAAAQEGGCGEALLLFEQAFDVCLHLKDTPRARRILTRLEDMARAAHKDRDLAQLRDALRRTEEEASSG